MACSLVLFISLVCAVVVAPSASLPVLAVQPTQDSWDYFLFVERYPPGMCYHDESHCSYPPNVTEWTVHGLWPTKDGEEGPNYCNQSATFDINAVRSLWPKLVAEWTNLEPNTAFGSFWAHEWLKHGTCATGVSSLSTEYSFFSTVLKLFENNFDFSGALDNADIKPSNTTTYTVDNFNDAFMKAYQVKPYLECSYSKEYGQVLIQMGLCLEKNFTIMPCPASVFNTTEYCWTSQQIHYVESQYPSVL